MKNGCACDPMCMHTLTCTHIDLNTHTHRHVSPGSSIMVVEIIRKDICDEDSKSSTNVLMFILFFKNGSAGTQSKQGL